MKLYDKTPTIISFEMAVKEIRMLLKNDSATLNYVTGKPVRD